MKLILCRICNLKNPDGLDGICEICMKIKTPDLCDMCGIEVYDDEFIIKGLDIFCLKCFNPDPDYEDFKSDLD